MVVFLWFPCRCDVLSLCSEMSNECKAEFRHQVTDIFTNFIRRQKEKKRQKVIEIQRNNKNICSTTEIKNEIGPIESSFFFCETWPGITFTVFFFDLVNTNRDHVSFSKWLFRNWFRLSFTAARYLTSNDSFRCSSTPTHTTCLLAKLINSVDSISPVNENRCRFVVKCCNRFWLLWKKK